ncbi:MAG: YCF48-related protein [Bacteroidota bacterium]
MMRIFQLLFICLGCLQTAHAQWINIPIREAASPVNFDTDGDDVYVLTSGGVYKSTDRGDHWNLVEGSRPLGIAAIQVQVDNGVIYILNSKGELNKTEDQGAHWHTIMSKPYLNPAPTEQISRIFVTGDTVLVGSKFTIYRSVDRGEHWAATVDWFCFDAYQGFAKVGPDLFAIVDWYILKSKDGGATWKQNFSASYEFGALFALDTVLFAKYAGYARIIRSYDRGQHWQVLDADTLGYFFNTTFKYEDGFAGNGDRLFYYKKGYQGTITHSSDNGNHWNTPTYFQDGYRFVDMLALPDRLLAATSEGLMRSWNEGNTFEPAMNGMDAGTVQAIAKSCKTRWYAQTKTNVLFSDDQGENWTSDSSGVFPLLTQKRIFTNNNCGYRYSQNNGQTWTNIPQITGCYNLIASGQDAWCYNETQIFRLKDGKTTPEAIISLPPSNYKITNLRADGGLLLCTLKLSDGSDAVFASSTKNIFWKPISLNPPSGYFQSNWCFSLDEKYVLGKVFGKLYLLHVGDDNWQRFYPINTATGDTIASADIRFIRLVGNKRYMGVRCQGLLYSTPDNPFHWYPYAPTLPYADPLCIYEDVKDVWVGTNGANIYALHLNAPTPLEPSGSSGHWVGADFTLFPNPGGPTATLQSNQYFSEPLSLKIFNAAGVLMYAGDLASGQQWTPDLTTLHAGLYFWQIKNATGAVTLKWTVDGGR